MINILLRVEIEDLQKFVGVFSTKGASNRKKYGSLSAQVFKVAEEEKKMIVLFEWESIEEFKEFLGDPEVKEAIKSAGAKITEYTFLEEFGYFPG